MKFFKKVLLAFILSVSLIQAANDDITISFNNMPLEDVVEFIAKTTNKNILLNDKLSGNVNFISNKPISKQELLPLLSNILKSKSYTLIENAKGYLEITREADAQSEAQLGDNSSISMNTKIIKLKNVQADTVVPKIKHLGSKYGVIIPDNGLNVLFITDYKQNTQNILKVLNALDVPSDNSIDFIKITNYEVDKLAPQIDAVINSMKNTFTGVVKLIGDPNSNSIVIVANKDDISKVKDLISSYDSQGSKIKINSAIVYLNNSEAEQITKTLTELIKELDVNSKIKTKIASNKELNAIVITGETEQIDVIKSLIADLDIERKQVYIKAQIYEISKNKTDKLGAKWGLAAGYADSVSLLSSSVNMGGSAFTIPDILSSNMELDVVNKGIAVGATLDLMKQNGAVDTLSEPHLLCVNNIESSIYVGRTQSILTSTVVGNTADAETKSSYTRTDIGIKLTIKPQISSDGKVTIDIKTLVENVDAANSSTDKPTTTKREVITSAIVQNGENIVIGGLVRDDNSLTLTKVPLLGDLPFLGALFSHKSEAGDKLNMVVIITPYIIEKSHDLQDVQAKIAEFDKLKLKMSKKLEEYFESKNGLYQEEDGKQ